MYPLIRIDLFGSRFDLAAYGLFLAIAGAVTVSMGWAIAVRRGSRPGKSALCILGIAASAVAGARLLDVATKSRLYEADPSGAFSIGLSGFSLYGGLLLALPTAALLCRALSLDPAHMADSLTPAAGTGVAIAKAGCFLAGCCFGVPTTLPWGVTFPFGSEAHLYQLFTGTIGVGRASLPVHPTELYEAAAATAGAIAAAWLLGQACPRGTVFLGFAVWFTTFRLLEDPLRASSLSFTAPSWFYPALYFAIIVLAGAVLALRLLTAASRRDWRNPAVPEEQAG